MLSDIFFFLFGFLGFGIHLLLKLRETNGGSLKGVWVYVKANQVKVAASLLTYMVLYGIWIFGDFKFASEVPKVLSPALAYMSDSLWIHLVNIAKKKVGMA